MPSGVGVPSPAGRTSPMASSRSRTTSAPRECLPAGHARGCSATGSTWSSAGSVGPSASRRGAGGDWDVDTRRASEAGEGAGGHDGRGPAARRGQRRAARPDTWEHLLRRGRRGGRLREDPPTLEDLLIAPPRPGTPATSTSSSVGPDVDCPAGRARRTTRACGGGVTSAGADTAEELMRSRFTAYALGDVDLTSSASWHPATRPDDLPSCRSRSGSGSRSSRRSTAARVTTTASSSFAPPTPAARCERVCRAAGRAMGYLRGVTPAAAHFSTPNRGSPRSP